MSKRNRRRRKKKNYLPFFLLTIIGLSAIIAFIFFLNKDDNTVKPEDLLSQYLNYLNDKDYDNMYNMLSLQSQSFISKDDFISRNKTIYDGINMSSMAFKIDGVLEEDKTQSVVGFNISMDTLAGNISFTNKAYFIKDENKEYSLLWSSHLIFPSLNSTDKVIIKTIKGTRGSILDRNGEVLAGKGTAYSVGIVPGKLGDNKEANISRIGEILDISPEILYTKINASYVKEDTFVPIKNISKESVEIEQSLLEIPGIKISNIEVRQYPLFEKASHLTGYIQNVNAEDLEKNSDKDYNINSIIGKSGLESVFEEQLRGIDGYEIIITDSENNKKETLASLPVKNGSSIKITIDAWLQSMLYEQFKSDKGTTVAINPKTGEVLALVSTPSFDSNDFVLGMSQSQWNTLNDNEDKPLYNRFKSALSPGSCIKPIIGAIGISDGFVRPEDNYGHEGVSWQKDGSWGLYKITTMKDYGNQVNMENALVYSDNIYFAKLALNIGNEALALALKDIGFDETIPFEYALFQSTFSNTGSFDSEIQLADSGYGQAQVLINPLHMASMYSAFVNDGNMIKPYLLYNGNPTPEYWKEGAFSEYAARVINDDLIQVIERGSGKNAKIEGLTLAGKTGTAELKQTKEDKKGVELGWLAIYTVDESSSDPILIISMVEDVRERGGSVYVIDKIKPILETR